MILNVGTITSHVAMRSTTKENWGNSVIHVDGTKIGIAAIREYEMAMTLFVSRDDSLILLGRIDIVNGGF